ncbi:MAG: methyltransferase domain-containing protein [Nanoarchaeota archaeon]
MDLIKLSSKEIEPNPIIIEALKYINENSLFKDKIAKVLDIGAGDGMDSIFLVKNGFNVTAIDSSSYSIHKINQLAKIHAITIKSAKFDAITFPFETSRFVFAQPSCFSSRASKSNLDGAQEPEHAPDFSPRVLDNYDIIICINVLHLIKLEEATELIKKMKMYTSVGGMNIVSLYINDDSPLNNLESFYTDWKIIHLNKSFHKVKKNKILLEFIAVKK